MVKLDLQFIGTSILEFVLDKRWIQIGLRKTSQHLEDIFSYLDLTFSDLGLGLDFGLSESNPSLVITRHLSEHNSICWENFSTENIFKLFLQTPICVPASGSGLINAILLFCEFKT